MSATSMIVTHMNAPYGAIVTEDDVVQSLRKGTFCAATADGRDILAAVFVECRRGLIERAGVELGIPVSRLKALYLESLRMGLPKVSEWDFDNRLDSPPETG